MSAIKSSAGTLFYSTQQSNMTPSCYVCGLKIEKCSGGFEAKIEDQSKELRRDKNIKATTQQLLLLINQQTKPSPVFNNSRQVRAAKKGKRVKGFVWIGIIQHLEKIKWKMPPVPISLMINP